MLAFGCWLLAVSRWLLALITPIHSDGSDSSDGSDTSDDSSQPPVACRLLKFLYLCAHTPRVHLYSVTLESI